MRRKIACVGASVAVGDMTQDAVLVRWPSHEATGADVVVVGEGDQLDEVAAFIARSAPAAVVVATDPAWCEELLERTGLPRGRVIGAADVPAVLDAVLAESGAELEVTVRHDGECGRAGFALARARIGAGGVLDIAG